MDTVVYHPIGIIRSPFSEQSGTPIQAAGAGEAAGTVEVFPEYEQGLADLDGFSHIFLIYHFHRSDGYSLRVKPYLDDSHRGVFATRAPRRPNSIGLSIVMLERIEKNILYIRDVDIVDGTPLLDIKPFVPDFDVRQTDRVGWLRERVDRLRETRDDGRFGG